MDKPLLYVDFNEMVMHDLVLLAKTDETRDADGIAVKLFEGMKVRVYMDDTDEAGKVDDLHAEGVVERNDGTTSWAKHVKWCCRINSDGIRAESEINGTGTAG